MTQSSHHFKSDQKKTDSITAAQFKFVVLCSAAVFLGVLFLAVFSHSMAHYANDVRSTVEYSICQFSGYNPECQFNSDYDYTTAISFRLIATSCLGLVTIVNLIFPLSKRDFQRIKSVIVNTWKRICRHSPSE